MRRSTITAIALTLVVAITSPAGASKPLDWSKETRLSACGAAGPPLVNVTQHVTGDMDSGFNGGWAVDTYTRRIKLWETGPGVYCAVVRYSGTFDAIEDAISPGEGSTSTLDGDEDGNFQGGYRATITGELVAEPGWQTHGTVGQFDYQCTAPGACPGAVDWVAQYLEPGYTFGYEFWGWVYRAGRNGVWVNASSGSSGDIG